MATLSISIDSIESRFPGPGGSVTTRASGQLKLGAGTGHRIDSVNQDPPDVKVIMKGGSAVSAVVSPRPPNTYSWNWTAEITGKVDAGWKSTVNAESFVSGEGSEFVSLGNWVPDGPFDVSASADKEFTAKLDDQGPILQIAPLEKAVFECPSPGSIVPIPMSGTANDNQESGVKGVYVGPDLGNLSIATAVGGDWNDWRANVNFPAQLGTHKIYAKAIDNVGNEILKWVAFTLQDTTPPILISVSPPAPPILHDAENVTLAVSGEVLDVASGVAEVLVSLWESQSDGSGGDKLVEVDPEKSVGVSTEEPNKLATWNASLTVGAAGNYQIKVRARDKDKVAPTGNVTKEEDALWGTVSVTLIPRPVPTITSHKDGDVVPGSDQGVDLVIRGTASADSSKVSAVYVVVDDAPFDDSSKASQGAHGWSTWSKSVHIPAEGSHTITARAVNSAKDPDRNHGETNVTLTVGIDFHPGDVQDNISLLAYFQDLLVFARKRIEITDAGGAKYLATSAILNEQFHQPFDALKVDDAVQQVRLCIEVLRGYLQSINRAPDASSEARYRLTAYQSLLTQFGTSYDELRRVSRAPTDDGQAQRKSLGDRMGISLDVKRLARLLMTPDHITEAEIETLFGLIDTTRDPLQSGQLPLLFQWQVDFLHSQWLTKDRSSDAVAPLVDPDILFAGDFASRSSSAYQRWAERKLWVEGQLTQLGSDRLAHEGDHDRLVRLVGNAMNPIATVADLLNLDALRKNGQDIKPLLTRYGLDVPAFSLLIRMHDLPADLAFLDDEWSDVYSILVQVVKRRSFASWRQQEAQDALILNQTNFIVAQDEPALPAWRATADSRRQWQDQLQARIDQQETCRQAFLSSIAAAEASALPQLRDVLVAACGSSDKVDIANWLTQRLMIDVKASGGIQTSRVAQAVETLQSILVALRAERFMEIDPDIAPLPPGNWNLTEPNAGTSQIGDLFDQEWTWMGGFGLWRAAMRVFLYPENMLLPSLRRGGEGSPHPEFDDFLKYLAGQQLISPKSARNAAKENGSESSYKGYLASLPSPIKDRLKALDPQWEKNSFVLDDGMAEVNLSTRAAAIKGLFEKNQREQTLQPYIEELFYFAPMHLALQLHQAGHFTAALDWFRTVYGYQLPAAERKVYYGLKLEEAIPSNYDRTDQWLRTKLNPHDLAPGRAGAFSRFTILSIVRCFLDFADAEFAADTGEAAARARTLYLSALDLLASADMLLPDGREPAEAFGFNANPEPIGLRQHAQLNLAKLRSGRNIAGLLRQSLSATAEGPVTGSLRPTPYRFATLMDRAKQLVTLAQQIEERYFAALEKQDAETYNLMKARLDLHLTNASVQLQDLRVVESSDGVALARQQKSRSQFQVDHFDGLLQAGLNEAERNSLALQSVAVGLQFSAANTSMLASSLPASISAGFSIGFPEGGSVSSSISSSPSGEQSSLASSMSSVAGATSTLAGISAAAASYERRKQEWELQKGIAQRDVVIGGQQFQQAQDHQRITTQERLIAQMQSNAAEATLNFLASKFTNAELYQWMGGILGRVYAYFLQQATAMARLAEGQLAFERQQRPLTVIRPDYWQAASEDSGASGGARDRKGLTGSARLLQDIYQLDQYAFDTNKRKLQLSKTISLASIAPVEFQRFRDSGVLLFGTPMTLFDRDFPGQYLRLIRRVRTSVVALVSPIQGIRATLGTAGLSRVVIPEAGYPTVAVQRNPEMVALTSPLNASGVFELDTQPELLLPFEGMGVDASWILEMPKASNPFDFRTIADVLVTFEYTALQSFDYRQQVIQQLNRVLLADRPFSLREQFPDQWYELNNPADATVPRIMRFTTARDGFPPNLDEVKIKQVLLYVVGNQGKTLSVTNITLGLSYVDDQSKRQTVGGGAQPIDGVISTRRSNGASWAPMIGAPPIGDWTLTLASSADLNEQITDGQLEDILLVISFTGLTPAW